MLRYVLCLPRTGDGGWRVAGCFFYCQKVVMEFRRLYCCISSYSALLLLLVHKIVCVTAMKIVVQRVKSASVKVNVNQNPTPISAIGPGILALVGLHTEDTESDLEWCAKRLLAMKLWENDSGASWSQVRDFCVS